MLKKIIYTGIVFMIFIFVLGCSQGVEHSEYSVVQESYSLALLPDETTPDRKIIYEVNISFDVRDLETSSDFLKTLIESDEWFDQEVITSSSHSYVIRVKTERLDDFISTLQDEFTLRSYRKVGTDISLQYQDLSNRILSLETQLERLLELYDQATLSEMIIINEAISDIEVELQSLQGSINQFDSLVDYSEVTLVFYGSTIVSQSPFFNRLGNAFVNGFYGLLTFFDVLLIGIATILPFIVIFGSIAVVLVIVYKKRRLKNKSKEEKKSKNIWFSTIYLKLFYKISFR